MMRCFVVALAISVASFANLRSAAACGGFFCSNQPIDQSAEHIAFGFSTDASGNTAIETHVQISFSGEAHNFAWVVPVHARPTLDVGTDALFTALDQATQPQFRLQYDDDRCMLYYPTAGGAADAGSAASDAGSSVQVLEQEDVGPYVATILTATDATEMTTWLQDNGYNLTDQGTAALTPYVGHGFFFVALKLQANRNVGELKPIVLKMTNTTPCIPIQLTAIAATQDMPIRAYFFAAGRAVPTNYRHVIINEEAIDWLNYGSNYSQVATAAVKEAGGHAFLTEFAGKRETVTSSFGFPIYRDGQYDTTELATITDPASFVRALRNEGYPRAGLLPLLERYVPEPASLVGSVSESQFYSDISLYQAEIDADPNRVPFDPVAFAAAIESDLIVPLKKAQALVDGAAYATRLYTTMSPADMTLDPEFAFNTGLPDVSNVHEAHATCLSSSPNGRIEIKLADGREYSVQRGEVPPRVAAAGIIEQLAAEGPPVEIENNLHDVPTAAHAGCHCGSSESAGLAAGLAALWVMRRRSRPFLR